MPLEEVLVNASKALVDPIIPEAPDPLVPVFALLKQRKGLLTQGEAARAVGLSTSRFRHVFKTLTGASYREVCVRAKLIHGVNLLQSTSLPIPQISTLLCYSDRTKFEKAFKKHYKVTPAQYRRQKTAIAATQGIDNQKTDL